jgi:beta-glucosidase
MGVLKAGDSEMAELALEAGQEIAVVVELRFTPARVHGLWYGIRSPGSREELLAAAEAAARKADAVFLIVGETSDSSVESKDRADTRLAPEQVALIERVTAANPRTAIVANVGHAFDSRWEDRAAALISAWYPGEGFSQALAEVLAGDREPGGRMPVVIARGEEDYPGYGLAPDGAGRLAYDDGVRFGHRGMIAAGKTARHTLGAGRGYAGFDWSDAAVDGAGVAVTVRNVSQRAGSEVVQVYRDAPETALVGFAKVMLEPGASARVRIPLPRRRFMTWGETGWMPIDTIVRVRVARSAEDAGLALDLPLDALAADGI